MRRASPRMSKPQQPSRVTRRLRSRQLWIADPEQSAVEVAVKKIARNEPAEIGFVQRNVNLCGWK